MTAYEQATATTELTTDRPATEALKDQAGAVAGTARNEAGHVAGAAATAASDVAGTAKEQAGQVATEAKNQFSTLANQAKTQVSEQAAAQTQKAAQTTRSFADQLQALSRGEGGQGPAADIVRDLGQRVALIADKLENSEPQELLDEVRRFARNKPGMFLIGAVAAGFVGGRLVKGATSETESDHFGSSTRPSAAGTATTYTPRYGGTADGAPTAGLVTPHAGQTYPTPYGAETYPEEPRQSTLGGSI